MAINETLKFSWGHIVAIVALIFISYVSFMGMTYLTDGDFVYAGLCVIIIDLLLIIFFLVPQIIKGTDEKFSRKIVFERILFFLAPFCFIATMIPYAHFWTVFDNRNKIENTFSQSINTTKAMFNSYEEYANSRIEKYDAKLRRLNTKEVSQINKVEALKLQILGNNYDNLKKASIEWINSASEATVWNVFMIGNIKEIENALDNWNKVLNTFSSKIMTDESHETKAFTNSDNSVNIAKKNLETLGVLYTTSERPTWIAILSVTLLYILLLFPYVLQRRNTKSLYRLIGHQRDSINFHNKKVDRLEEEKTSTETDDYAPFTM